MSIVINVNCAELRGKVKYLREMINEYCTIHDSLYSKLVDNTWNGKDKESFVTQAEALRQNIDRMVNNIILLENVVEQSLQEYQKAADKMPAYVNKI